MLFVVIYLMIHLVIGAFVYWSLGEIVKRIGVTTVIYGKKYSTGPYYTDRTPAVPTRKRLIWSVLGPLGLVRTCVHIYS